MIRWYWLIPAFYAGMFVMLVALAFCKAASNPEALTITDGNEEEGTPC